MGYADRIARPTNDRVVALADVSKAQLAAALNEQSARFKMVRQQLEAASRVLCAIVLEPESLTFGAGGRSASVDMGAVRKVKDGMQLAIDEASDVMQLVLRDPSAPQAETPRIVIPAGN